MYPYGGYPCCGPGYGMFGGPFGGCSSIWAIILVIVLIWLFCRYCSFPCGPCRY